MLNAKLLGLSLVGKCEANLVKVHKPQTVYHEILALPQNQPTKFSVYTVTCSCM